MDSCFNTIITIIYCLFYAYNLLLCHQHMLKNTELATAKILQLYKSLAMIIFVFELYPDNLCWQDGMQRISQLWM